MFWMWGFGFGWVFVRLDWGRVALRLMLDCKRSGG